jgi:hypothetical protein
MFEELEELIERFVDEMSPFQREQLSKELIQNRGAHDFVSMVKRELDSR